MLFLDYLLPFEFHFLQEILIICESILLVIAGQLELINAKLYLKAVVSLNMLVFKDGAVSLFVLSGLQIGLRLD